MLLLRGAKMISKYFGFQWSNLRQQPTDVEMMLQM